MIVAFLDLLGFSQLIEQSEISAFEVLNIFNFAIKTKVTDEKTHPIEEYERLYPDDKEIARFAEKNSLSSVKYLISISDSLVLASNDESNLFIEQLSCLLAALYINYSKPFKSAFIDIRQVYCDSFNQGVKRMAFPIVFRGGLSEGDNCAFFKEIMMNNGKFSFNGYNVFGGTYLKAVKLEKVGKGPRLFCDKSIIDSVQNRSLFRLVDKEKEVYEIVWTIMGCESTGCSVSEPWNNVVDRIRDKMLPATINLYKYYKNNRIKDENVWLHYKELLTLVCRGIVKYAKDKCNKAENALGLINQKLKANDIEIFRLDELMEGFIE